MISHRRLLALTAATLTAAALFGCAPTPDPTPEPLFTTEAEAFAAAEEVYRAYNAAMPTWLAGDESESPLDFVTGTLTESTLETRAALERDRLSPQGHIEVVSFTGSSAVLETEIVQVEAIACVDNRGLRILNAEGVDVTPEQRPDLVAFDISFVSVKDALLVSDSRVRQDLPC